MKTVRIQKFRRGWLLRMPCGERVHEYVAFHHQIGCADCLVLGESDELGDGELEAVEAEVRATWVAPAQRHTALRLIGEIRRLRGDAP